MARPSALEIFSSIAQASIGRPSIRVSTIFVLSMGDQSRVSMEPRWAFEYFIVNRNCVAVRLGFIRLTNFYLTVHFMSLLNYSNSCGWNIVFTWATLHAIRLHILTGSISLSRYNLFDTIQRDNECFTQREKFKIKLYIIVKFND